MVCGKTAWAKKQCTAPTNCVMMCISCVQTLSTLKGLFIQDQEQPGPYGGSDLTHKPANNICRAGFRPVALQLARVPETGEQGRQTPRTPLGDGRIDSGLGGFLGAPLREVRL